MLRQRRRGELLGPAQGGDRHPYLARPGHRSRRGLLLHRDLLQPPPPAQAPDLRLPHPSGDQAAASARPRGITITCPRSRGNFRQAFLRSFDLEHTFRLFKQTLGWTVLKIRTPQAADRWTWIIIAAHTQLRLARPLAEDLRRPWERPALPDRLTPARVRRGFRNLRPHITLPARAPKPSRPGPGRPPGSRNRQPAPRYDVGKTVKRDMTITARQKRSG